MRSKVKKVYIYLAAHAIIFCVDFVSFLQEQKKVIEILKILKKIIFCSTEVVNSFVTEHFHA